MFVCVYNVFFSLLCVLVLNMFLIQPTCVCMFIGDMCLVCKCVCLCNFPSPSYVCMYVCLKNTRVLCACVCVYGTFLPHPMCVYLNLFMAIFLPHMCFWMLVHLHNFPLTLMWVCVCLHFKCVLCACVCFRYFPFPSYVCVCVCVHGSLPPSHMCLCMWVYTFEM
jgi:hypothetical protein